MTDADIAELSKRLQSALGESYSVERPLGAGGFAVVFLVRDQRLKRMLAVKVLSPDIIASHRMLERFEHEAQTIAQLSHPNIVPLHFVGREGEMLFLAMAYVEGGTIADRIAGEGPLSIEAASRLFGEMAGALLHAHRRGVVHRDIKPQNILVEQETGRSLLSDFGIARSADTQSLTASGLILGTPAYLAPEQVAGEAADHRADIYALGTVMYEALSGHQPFEATTPTAMIMKRLAGPPRPLQELRPDVPAALLAAVDRCLASRPEDRFQSADEILTVLSGQSTPSVARPAPATTRAALARRNRVWLAARFGVVGVVVVAAWFALSRDDEQPTTPSVAAVDSGMVLVPAGDYIVGFDSGPVASRPAHRVTIGAFGIGRTEVTVADYAAYVSAVGLPAPWPADRIPPATTPMTGVQFSDAMSYCRWRHPDAGRLPTEEEWEAAARGLAGRRYPWGDDPPRGRADIGSNREAPLPVGSFPNGATPEGIQDLIGSVWEWTASPPLSYPGNTPFGDTDERVIRGGAFDTYDMIATAWHRVPYSVTGNRTQLSGTGFRCLMPARRADPGSKPPS